MRRSVRLNQLFGYSVLERFWRDADELGLRGVYAFDHFYGRRRDRGRAGPVRPAVGRPGRAQGGADRVIRGFSSPPPENLLASLAPS
jgi:hypothetical protein